MKPLRKDMFVKRQQLHADFNKWERQLLDNQLNKPNLYTIENRTMDKIALREQVKTLRQGFKQGVYYTLSEVKPKPVVSAKPKVSTTKKKEQGVK